VLEVRQWKTAAAGGTPQDGGVHGGGPQDPADPCGGRGGRLPRGGGPQAGAVDGAGEGRGVGGVEAVHAGGLLDAPGGATGGPAVAGAAQSLLLHSQELRQAMAAMFEFWGYGTRVVRNCKYYSNTLGNGNCMTTYDPVKYVLLDFQ